MASPADLYRVLGVAVDASHHEIVHAYRRLAHASHPDTRPDDPNAAGRFQEVTAAYEVLADPARRAAYDRTLPAAPPSAPRPSRPVPASSDWLITEPPTDVASFRPPAPAAFAEPLLRVGPVDVAGPGSPLHAPRPAMPGELDAMVRAIVAWLDRGWGW